MKVDENDRDDKNVHQRDFKKEKPTEAHKLVPAKTWQGPAYPHEQKDECGNFNNTSVRFSAEWGE